MLRIYDGIVFFAAFVAGSAAIVGIFAEYRALNDVKAENAALRAERERLLEIVLREDPDPPDIVAFNRRMAEIDEGVDEYQRTLDSFKLAEPVLTRETDEEMRRRLAPLETFEFLLNCSEFRVRDFNADRKKPRII